MGEPIDLHNILQSAFPGISERESEEILSAARVKSIPGGTVLCHEGAYENTFYILTEGEVKVSKIINDSEKRVLKTLSPGDFFGEMAIVHNAPRAATITATVPSTVLEIQKDSFSNLLEHSSSVSLAVVRMVSRRLRENDEMAIEDLRQKARELADAYQQLAEQDYSRRTFLTTIAHELRTPLMAANGFLQIIKSGMLQGETLQSALDTVSRNLAEITTLTNDILFLQEMDLIMSEFRPTDIGGIVVAAVEQQRSRAERNQVRIKLDIAPGIPSIQADGKSLERAITAILDNAIKFSPDGGEVRVEVGYSREQVFVKIEDNGVGIPNDVLPRIFDRFFHLDKVGNHLFRGAGLGLSIARQVIDQHKGKIEVTSDYGRGSVFNILLNKK